MVECMEVNKKAIRRPRFDSDAPMEMPAIFIAYMHRSDLGLGCAAHNNNEEEAYKATINQTSAIRKILPRLVQNIFL